MNNSPISLSRLILLAGVVALFLTPIALSNQDEVRELGRTDWQKERAKSASKNPTIQKNPHSPTVKATYEIKERMPQTSSTDKAEIGVTFWRMRPSKETDAVEVRDLIDTTGSATKQEYTMERVESEAELTEGQMVRLMIESLREGYLYVINRARYADGSYGDPYLIFPTQKRNDGRNHVEAGKAVLLPGADAADYFELKRGSRQGELQVSEELIIIVKPEPLEAFKTAPANRKLLTAQSVEALIAKYKTPYERSEMKNGTGKAITVGEKKATKDLMAQLSEDDPYPQTIFRLGAKPTNPMLVIVQLKVSGRKDLQRGV